MNSTERDRFLGILLAEDGYLEKKDYRNLYDKQSNAGKNNYTKYWDMLLPAWQGSPWCACFISWAARECNISENVIPTFYDCDVGLQFYIRAKQFYDVPEAGDIIFFGTKNDSTHVGVVLDKDVNYVYTIEGNTSSTSGVVPNGGAVCKKHYLLNNSRIIGYGRPKYKELEPMLNYQEFVTCMNQWLKAEGKKMYNKDIAPDEFMAAIQAGITDGTCPQKPCTRQEAAVMAYRAGIGGNDNGN